MAKDFEPASSRIEEIFPDSSLPGSDPSTVSHPQDHAALHSFEPDDELLDLGDERVLITDLEPVVAGARRRLFRLITALQRALERPWIRYGVSGLLVAILLGICILQTRPAPAVTPTYSSLATITYSRDFLNFVPGADQVFLQSNNNTLLAYQAGTGRLLWHDKLDGLANLLLVGQTLYCYVSGSTEGNLLALDTRTGHVDWTQSLPPPGIAPLFQGGDALYVGAATARLYVFQLSTGRLRWSYAYGANSPAVLSVQPLSGLLQVQNGLVEIKEPGTFLVRILQAGSGQEVQTISATLSTNGPTFLPIDTQQLVYSFSNSQDQGLPTSTETIEVFHKGLLWKGQFPSGSWSPIEANGVIYLVNANGSLTALRGVDGKALWSTTPSSPASGEPELEAGLLYVFLNDNELMCLNAGDGRIVWQSKIDASASMYTQNLPPVENGIMLLSSFVMEENTPSYVFYALRASDGKVLWHSLTPVGVLSLQAGFIYIIENNNNSLDAWRESDGTFLWSYRMSYALALVWSSDAQSGLVYLLDLQNGLTVLQRTSAHPLWHYAP